MRKFTQFSDLDDEAFFIDFVDEQFLNRSSDSSAPSARAALRKASTCRLGTDASDIDVNNGDMPARSLAITPNLDYFHCHRNGPPFRLCEWRPGPFLPPQSTVRAAISQNPQARWFMGKEVLVRARVSDEGRTLTVAPGVDVPAAAVERVADLPPVPDELRMVLVMGFDTAAERQTFADEFHAWIEPSLAAGPDGAMTGLRPSPFLAR